MLRWLLRVLMPWIWQPLPKPRGSNAEVDVASLTALPMVVDATNVPEPVLWRLMHCAHEQLATGLMVDDGPSTRATMPGGKYRPVSIRGVPSRVVVAKTKTHDQILRPRALATCRLREMA